MHTQKKNASMFVQHGAQGYMASISSSPKHKYAALEANNKCDNPYNAQIYKKKQQSTNSGHEAAVNRVQITRNIHVESLNQGLLSLIMADPNSALKQGTKRNAC